MKIVQVTIRGRYRNASATLRAKAHDSALTISKRAFAAAEDKVTYAGTDYGVLESVTGYAPWVLQQDGSWRCERT